jgi:hypothetical protein
MILKVVRFLRNVRAEVREREREPFSEPWRSLGQAGAQESWH